jgi:hypothetical protein
VSSGILNSGRGFVGENQMIAVRNIARRRLWASSASSSESPVAFRSCFFSNRLTLSEDVDPDDDAEETDPEIEDTPSHQL